MGKLREQAIEDLVYANKILHKEGVMFEAFGHISVRDPENPEQFLLSRSLAPMQVSNEDIYTYDLQGNCLTLTDKKSYAERVIHSEIYKARPNVMSICHHHAQSIIPFTVNDISFKPLTHYGANFYKGIPVYNDYDVSDGMLIRNSSEGERLARTLGECNAIFLRGHGAVVVGSSIISCVMNSIFMTIDAENQLRSLLVSKPKYLSYEEARTCAVKTWDMELCQERAWNFWKAKVDNGC